MPLKIAFLPPNEFANSILMEEEPQVAGAYALLDCSKLPCALGGLITFDHSGQLA